MKKTFKAILLCLAITFSAFSARASDIQKIQQNVAKPDTLCGQFTQKKTLIGVSKPVISTGRFCVNPNKGVLWKNIKPFANYMRLTQDEIILYKDGDISNRISSSKEPMIEFINGLIFSIVAGDFSKLQEHFNINAKINGGKWNAVLTAKTSFVAKFLKQIHIDGDNYIRHVTLKEQSGDATSITFSGMQTGPSAIKADEAEIF